MPKSNSTDASHDDDASYISKSERKRAVEQLQKLGQSLVELTDAQLAALTLDESLREAIVLARKIKNKHEAFRRQLQYIGKVMRQVDAEDIAEQLAHVRQESVQAKHQLHQLERLRTELIEQGDARLEVLLTEHPQLERQALRQWIRQAQKEAQAGKTPKASRALFAYLRDHIFSIRGDAL